MDLHNNYQRRLFPYAYGILGSAEDAKDAIQDVLTKYISSSKHSMENEIGYLIKSVVNQSINIKKRNQKIVGDRMWLPEPVATEEADTDINREEIISYSLLVLLEKLDPKERAVFILKEAFDYSHQEIADVFSFSIENSRKILSRAKTSLEGVDVKFKPIPSDGSGLLQQYISVIKEGNVNALEKLLSEAISVKTDGGGKIAIISEHTIGIKTVIAHIIYVYNTHQKSLSVDASVVNHQPALLFYNDGKLVCCQVFELENGNAKIKNIYTVVDPAKLKANISS